jgi:hypothetical protein
MFNIGDRVIYMGSHEEFKNTEGIVAEVYNETVSVDLDPIEGVFTPRIYFHTSSVARLLLKVKREPDWEV